MWRKARRVSWRRGLHVGLGQEGSEDTGRGGEWGGQGRSAEATSDQPEAGAGSERQGLSAGDTSGKHSKGPEALVKQQNVEPSRVS